MILETLTACIKFAHMAIIQAMDRFTSPVFLSVSERGELEEGLGGVPDHQSGRSILFVGNHQLLGIDMPILVSQMLPPVPIRSGHRCRSSSQPQEEMDV